KTIEKYGFYPKMCHNCAFLPGSTERHDFAQEYPSQLSTILENIDNAVGGRAPFEPFFCHREMPSDDGGKSFQPEFDDEGLPVGHKICAGWIAEVRQMQAIYEEFRFGASRAEILMQIKICVNCNHNRLLHNAKGAYCMGCHSNCDFLPEREEYARHRQRLTVLRFGNRVVKFQIVSENGSEAKEYRHTRKFFDEVFLPGGGWKRVEAKAVEIVATN
ncbi:MAG TPA: hypothetical protein VF648_00490, partial [Pyrinomonadaceae bacterium]